MKKNMILILMSLVVFIGCLDPSPRTPVDYYAIYMGQWQLIGTSTPDIFTPDSSDVLFLWHDSTFACSFSYFLDQDSSERETITGRWRPGYELVYHGIGYSTIDINKDSLSKVWKVRLSKANNTTYMNWYEYGFDSEQVLFSWKYIGGAHLPPEDLDERADKK